MNTNHNFTALYNQNLEDCKRFSKFITRDQAMAEDLIQEAAMKAFQRFEKFNPELGSFKNWMFTIIKNTYITGYNKRKRRSIISLPVEECAFAIDSKRRVENAGVSQLNMDNINRCINMLSHKSRKSFQLYITGYQYNEISEQLSIPIGTVKSRINFARTKLKSMLKNTERAA